MAVWELVLAEVRALAAKVDRLIEDRDAARAALDALAAAGDDPAPQVTMHPSTA